MPLPSPTEARFPRTGLAAGLYESFYLRACHPDGGIGVWIRYTVHKRPGSPPTGSVWFTLFEASAPGPRASKQTLPAPSAGGADWIRIGDSRFGPGAASGAALADGRDCRWELRFEAGEAPLHHLRRGWMYTAPVPRTKLLSPAPAARFSGRVLADGREVVLGDWPGMVGHNWGVQHAERWIWLHGLGFRGASAATWLDVALARVKLGPLTTPWIASGALSVDGNRYPLGGPERARSTVVREAPDGCRFTLPGPGVSVRGEVSAARKDVAGWLYADPDGHEHHAVNCSIADLRLHVTRPSRDPLALELAGGAVYELGMREHDHGIPIQPFRDGEAALATND
jgi:hypothetical protein